MSGLAARQWGRVRWDQLRALGISEATICAWVRDGYLHRELPRVYAIGHPRRSTESDLAAALLYAGPGAQLSHDTTLWWHGLLGHPSRVIHISTPRSVASRPGRIQVHSRRRLPSHMHRGFPTTSVSQAIVDFAPQAQPRLLRFVLANADYEDVLDVSAIQSLIGRGVPGTVKLREALEHHLPQLAATRSEAERRLLALCQEHGLAIPQTNVYVAGHLVDAVWPDRRLVVEVDGYLGHRSRAQLNADHQRALELRAAGYVVLRYTWAQLVERPEEVVADLLRHL